MSRGDGRNVFAIKIMSSMILDFIFPISIQPVKIRVAARIWFTYAFFFLRAWLLFEFSWDETVTKTKMIFFETHLFSTLFTTAAPAPLPSFFYLNLFMSFLSFLVPLSLLLFLFCFPQTISSPQPKHYSNVHNMCALVGVVKANKWGECT